VRIKAGAPEKNGMSLSIGEQASSTDTQIKKDRLIKRYDLQLAMAAIEHTKKKTD
tara:strand:- start:227 stop:391 length:165 start_codon:yes stop_codon:yes gene_type:complete